MTRMTHASIVIMNARKNILKKKIIENVIWNL